MQCKTGTYVGTGIPHGINWTTGPFFTPDVVVIKADSSQYAVFRTSAMPAFQTAAFSAGASLFSNAITAFIANGFQINTHATVNAVGINYYWAAFDDNGAGDIDIGVYTSNGDDNRNLDIVGFQPTAMWIKCHAGYEGVWRVEENTGLYSMKFSASPNYDNAIQALRPLGFQVGSSELVNSYAEIYYYYVAFKDVPGFIETGTYTGNGIDDRNINVGFEPDMVWVKGEDYQDAVLRIDTMPTGQSGNFAASALLPDRIQGFAANVFQVGVNADVNSSGVKYYWVAWKVGSSYAATTTTSTFSTTSTSTFSTTSTTTTSTLSTTLTTTTLPFTPVPGTSAVLRICDKEGCVNLLKRKKQSGYRLCGWTPRIADYKRGGIWQDSPIAEGRRLAQRRFGNVVETMNLSMSGHKLETLIRESQDLRRLMEKASDYWWADWQNDPIWIEARAKCETNVRYAILHRGKILVDNSPYEQPFMERRYGRTAARNLNLILERGHWMSLPPERSASVLASARECYEGPYHLKFDGDSSIVNCGSDAGLNDIPDSAQITVDGWVKSLSAGEEGRGVVAQKTSDGGTEDGWYLRVRTEFGLAGRVNCVTDAISRSGTDEFDPTDGIWHHVLMTYDETGADAPAARTVYLAIDGVWITSYQLQSVGAGAYASDAAWALTIGNSTGVIRTFDGSIGWTRVSDNVRYTVNVNFTPPERCGLPAIDVNTLGQWIGVESSGTTIDSQEGTAARDGTQSNCLFDVDCERCYGNVDSEACWPHYLEFDGANSVVNCGKDVGLNNIPDSGSGQITVDGWVRSLSTGEAGTGIIMQKSSNAGSAEGWRLRVRVDGLAGRVNGATDAQSISGTDEFDPTDGVWHHVLMTYDKTGASTPAALIVYLAIDGAWVTSYTVQIVGVLPYSVDNAQDLTIGNNVGVGRTFDGDIGWMRVSNNIRYAVNVNFAPPTRCSLPAIDANTLGQWIGEEPPGVTIVNQEGTDTRNGTQTTCTFGCDCTAATDGEVHPVADHVYVANKRNKANITHIFRYDASLATYSANLVGTVPYNLLPITPAVGDMVYFGIQSGTDPSGFSSLVFDLENAHSDITGITWEYYGGVGVWTPIILAEDNTENWFNVAFGQTSINSVVWQITNNYIGATVNGVAGFWVRARVTGIGGAPTPPRQQNRDVYTVTWPYLEIDSGQVGGDIVALARYEMVSAGMEADDVMVGLRSLSRGADFSAYLNCGGRQNPPGVTVTASGNCHLWSDYWHAPCRYVAYYTAGADGKFEIKLGPSIASQYYGVYHAYLRGYRDGSGTKGDTSFNVSFEQGSGQVVQQKLTGLYLTPYAKYELVDLGRLELSPPSLLDGGEEYNENKIVVDVSGVEDMRFYDFILIPIDEWAGRFIDLEQGANSTNRLSPGRLLEFESVRHPKQQIRANLWSRNSDRIVGHWDKRANGPVILQANADQRLWVLASLIDADLDTIISRPEILTWFSVEAVQRYLSMRGDR